MCFFQFNLAISHHKHAGPEPQSQCPSTMIFKMVRYFVKSTIKTYLYEYC